MRYATAIEVATRNLAGGTNINECGGSGSGERHIECGKSAAVVNKPMRYTAAISVASDDDLAARLDRERGATRDAGERNIDPRGCAAVFEITMLGTVAVKVGTN